MKIETIQLTADAYYYLHSGEEPIDPDNIEEADELIETYKPRFNFISKPEPIGGTDMVEVKISVAERLPLPGTDVVDFVVLPNKKVRVVISNLGQTKNFESLDTIADLEPIGDAYWAQYAYYEDSKTRNLLPVCKISEYEKLFG